MTPYLLGGAALGFFPGLWLYSAYAYPYGSPYHYHNNTNNDNETLPVECLCQQYSACGCDDSGNSTSIDALFSNGSVSDNSTVARITNVNGTRTLVINGTLPNGTDDNGTTSTSAPTSAGYKQTVLEMSGFWVMGATVALTVWLL